MKKVIKKAIAHKKTQVTAQEKRKVKAHKKVILLKRNKISKINQT
jgi:hypothetical protein